MFLTPGLVIGRFRLSEDIEFTTGVGYQVAVSPHYQATPLTPAYNNGWVFTTRFNFEQPVDPTFIGDLFAPFAVAAVRRRFGGAGVYWNRRSPRGGGPKSDGRQ